MNGREQYLKQIGIDTWQRRGDPSLFPGVIEQLAEVESKKLSVSSDVINEKMPNGELHETAFFHGFEFSSGALVIIEKAQLDETFEEQRMRVLSGILRSIGITEISSPTVLNEMNSNQVSERITDACAINVPCLCFFEDQKLESLISADSTDSVFLGGGFNEISTNSSAKSLLWSRLKNRTDYNLMNSAD